MSVLLITFFVFFSKKNNKKIAQQKAKATGNSLESMLGLSKVNDDRPGMHHGAVINAKHGFFVMLIWYLQGRIPTCNSYCIICDQVSFFLNFF